MGRIVLMAILALHVVAAPHVAKYHAEIRSVDARIYTVDIAVTIGEVALHKPSYTLDGDVLNRTTLDHAVRPGGTYHLSYTAAGGGHRVRIPLAVPEIPTAGSPGSVVIEVALPGTSVIAGDMFPAFKRNDSGTYVAELANIPNHVEFEVADADKVGFREHWLTPTALSDGAVLAFLAAGSLARFLLRKTRAE